MGRGRLATVLAGILGTALVAMPATSPGAERTVVVRAGTAVEAARAVRDAGGIVTYGLPIVSGVAARIPASGLDRLARVPGVAVTPDEKVSFAGDLTSETNTQTINSVYARETNAEKLWAQGINGRDVVVALVDTGVARVPDLEGQVQKVPDPTDRTKPPVECVDFSGDGSCNDFYGHGTFIAGLISGTGRSSGGLYTGVAPGAKIVSVKIAGRDGSADVSKVLAAIQWVVSFAPELGIKVLNLSLGTNSRISYTLEPLNYAVEQAWRAGITVVVAASNLGPRPGTISKPGDDPFVITVGAVDDRETPAIDDDRLPAFSGRGKTEADGLDKPDVVAPGGRVVSLRSPGSFIDAKAPVPAGDLYAKGYRRGSGTSMATGVTSGLAALLSQARSWSPDRIKFAMMTTARKVASRDPLGVGQGLVDVQGALAAGPGLANGGVAYGLGTGSLDGSRGSVYVTSTCSLGEAVLDPACDRVHGDMTGQDKMFEAERFRNDPWTGSSWYTSQWVGSSWYGSSWYGCPSDGCWLGSSWYGSSWYGSEDSTFYGASVSGSSWYGAWQ